MSNIYSLLDDDFVANFASDYFSSLSKHAADSSIVIIKGYNPNALNGKQCYCTLMLLCTLCVCMCVCVCEYMSVHYYYLLAFVYVLCVTVYGICLCLC